MDAAHAPARLSTIEMLARLVAFDTTSRNPNGALIGFVRQWLDTHGVPYRLSGNEAAGKTSIHAVIGPPVAGGIALSGHVDTVPVDGQAWSGDPFTLRREGGRLIARGACDMKGFVAACLAAVPDLVARRLARPVHLFITYDEETTCEGAQRLIAALPGGPPPPAMCIVGEPSSMHPIVAHKGVTGLRVIAHGKPAHSSRPLRGVNAIYAAARAIGWVEAEAARIAREGPFEDGFDPPHTTAHVGTVAGGTALNIVPERAEFVMEWRTLPGDDGEVRAAALKRFIAAEIEPAMRASDPACGFSYQLYTSLPGMKLPDGHELADLMRQLTGSNEVGKVAYGTEGGHYQRAGIPTIVCGPGDIAQAHTADEWIAESELAAADAFIRRLADRLGT